MADLTLTLETGQSITLRKPSETEVLAYLDKRAKIEAGIRPSSDAFDDGDYELCACVTSPSQADLAALLEDYPLLNRRLRDAFITLSGGDKPYRRDDSVITNEHKKATKRLIGFLFDGTPVVLMRLTRYEMKAIEDEVRAQGLRGPLPSALARIARAHVVAKAEELEAVKTLLTEYPLLSANLGMGLLQAAQARLLEEEKKS